MLFLLRAAKKSSCRNLATHSKTIYHLLSLSGLAGGGWGAGGRWGGKGLGVRAGWLGLGGWLGLAGSWLGAGWGAGWGLAGGGTPSLRKFQGWPWWLPKTCAHFCALDCGLPGGLSCALDCGLSGGHFCALV